MATNIKPLGNRVLVKLLEEQEQKKGGIIIPDTAKEKPEKAEVIAIGSGKVMENGQKTVVEVKVGDKILIPQYGGKDLKIDGEEYMIVDGDDVLAIVS